MGAWLGDVSVDKFRSRTQERVPLARPAAFDAPNALLDWEILAQILAVIDARDVLVVSRGALLPFPPPRSLSELHAYFDVGIGLCLRRTERCHPAIRAIADAFEIVGPSHVQIFVTPKGTHGFGWHYDDEDVFIVQTEGMKDYYFRANTVASEITANADVFARYREESSALCTSTLIPGDVLYLPSRWWHMAVCSETSLSISVGVQR